MPKKSSINKSSKKYVKKISLKKSIGSKKISSSRGSATRGWKAKEPHRGVDRNKMLKNCGTKCFIDPKNKKYPICDADSCKVDKKGVQAAYNRARQYHHQDIANKARKILNKM